jgi:hypothetical protein
MSTAPRRKVGPGRVARWFVFKPKIPILVNLGGFCNGKTWYIFRPIGLFYGRWKYFMAIWYILWYFVQRKIWQPCLFVILAVQRFERDPFKDFKNDLTLGGQFFA